MTGPAGRTVVEAPAPDASLLRAIHVPLAERAYDVMVGPGIGLNAGERIATTLGAKRCAIVTDENLAAAMHLTALEHSLRAGGIEVLGSVVLRPGEATKCFSELQVVVESLLRFGVERRDVVVALGGGVIGDLAGFAASILRRGVRFVQLPTTLLAQVDSSVGGKTGINTAQGKNLAGTFHQPSLVLADTGTLATLPDRQMRAGYAEIAKHAALGDEAYLTWLERNVEAVLRRDQAALVHAVARSVEMKAAIVVRDETEQGDRMLLNLGHTFGHALEAWAGFSDRLLHGEAVAIGTAIAFRFSAARGLCPPADAERMTRHLTAAGLPTRIADLPQGPTPSVAELMRLMAQDKKVQGGRMTFILAHGIGKAFVSRDVEAHEAEGWIAREIAGAA